MDDSKKSSPCKECDEFSVSGHLQAEVEHLRQHLAERDAHLGALEGEFIKCSSRADDLEEQVGTWREKYERLYDSYKRVQKLNQVLEDKLLQMVDKMKSEKSQLTKDIATLSVRLAESKHNYTMLQKENERYKNDMNLATQLLQCKPDNFVSQKLDNLPVDTQARVSQYVMSKSSATKPLSSTLPKNASDYDMTNNFDASEYEFNISASLMSKILEDSIQDTLTKHCDTCTCTKSQNKPFCYNESYYSVSTQTNLSGDMKTSLCLNCNSEMKPGDLALSIRSASPSVKLLNEKTINQLTSSMYLMPQPVNESRNSVHDRETGSDYSIKDNLGISNEKLKIQELMKIETNVLKESVTRGEFKQIRKNNTVSIEPTVHHKLCDRTKTPVSSKKSSIHSNITEDYTFKEVSNSKEVKLVNETNPTLSENMSFRKNSQSSMGAPSRTSSIAKSTVSTHKSNKSNTHVGPGPRFCHLRMQAGSKNILLDNAQPDVPPIIYRRHSKCNEDAIFKDFSDGLDLFVGPEKYENDNVTNTKENTNFVVESTLIDVHVDNNNKESTATETTSLINPVLLNVSSSPLQPLKTHNFSTSSENNNNNHVNESQKDLSEIDKLLDGFNSDKINNLNSNFGTESAHSTANNDTLSPKNNDIQLFNFDRYEQRKLAALPDIAVQKIDMTQLYSIESTRISKNLTPENEHPKTDPKSDSNTFPAIVNVYPNIAQTKLTNSNKKMFAKEQSTSSLSSDDSASQLQKQQLLRVAEWVEQNLERHNSFNDSVDDDMSVSNKAARSDREELPLNMPHPVSKYSKTLKHKTRSHKSEIAKIEDKHLKNVILNSKFINNIVKETIFPVESNEEPSTELDKDSGDFFSKGFDMAKDLRNVLNCNGDREITPEELARMEYNVKKFLLSGPCWTSSEPLRSRRTSSKTETDV